MLIQKFSDEFKKDSTQRFAYTRAEAAKETTLSERTIFELNKTGKLPCIRVGRRVLIPAEALRKFINGEDS